MKKQTAVGWLVNRWKKLQSEQEKMTWNQIIQITELAKEMEKENSEISFFAGYNYDGGHPVDEHEQYYKETFTEK